jgi:quercetin dioxygenase-like cupin family protein
VGWALELFLSPLKSADMFSHHAQADALPWQPGPYPGVELKFLHRHEHTGGVIVLRKFAAGTTVPAHIHPQANEWAWILSGQWKEDDSIYGPGTLFFAAQGTPHGPHHALNEVISLTIFDGPLTVVAAASAANTPNDNEFTCDEH